MIKTVFKTLLLLAAVGYLIYAAIGISRPTEEVVCNGVEYVLEDTIESQFITTADVQNILNAHKIAPKGMKMGNIDLREIEKTLSSSPYIDTASCYQTASGKLCVRVTPMHPVLHVMADGGDEYYLDRTGKIMPIGELNANLCIATGPFSRKFAAKHLTKLGSFILGDEFWSLNAQQIVVDKKGHVEIIPRVGDFVIQLGSISNLEDKLYRLRKFYEEGLPQAGWNRYTHVSAEFDKQIVCQRRKFKPGFTAQPVIEEKPVEVEQPATAETASAASAEGETAANGEQQQTENQQNVKQQQ